MTRDEYLERLGFVRKTDDDDTFWTKDGERVRGDPSGEISPEQRLQSLYDQATATDPEGRALYGTSGPTGEALLGGTDRVQGGTFTAGGKTYQQTGASLDELRRLYPQYANLPAEGIYDPEGGYGVSGPLMDAIYQANVAHNKADTTKQLLRIGGMALGAYGASFLGGGVGSTLSSTEAPGIINTLTSNLSKAFTLESLGQKAAVSALTQAVVNGKVDLTKVATGTLLSAFGGALGATAGGAIADATGSSILGSVGGGAVSGVTQAAILGGKNLLATAVASGITSGVGSVTRDWLTGNAEKIATTIFGDITGEELATRTRDISNAIQSGITSATRAIARGERDPAVIFTGALLDTGMGYLKGDVDALVKRLSPALTLPPDTDDAPSGARDDAQGTPPSDRNDDGTRVSDDPGFGAVLEPEKRVGPPDTSGMTTLPEVVVTDTRLDDDDPETVDDAIVPEGGSSVTAPARVSKTPVVTPVLVSKTPVGITSPVKKSPVVTPPSAGAGMGFGFSDTAFNWAYDPRSRTSDDWSTPRLGA